MNFKLPRLNTLCAPLLFSFIIIGVFPTITFGDFEQPVLKEEKIVELTNGERQKVGLLALQTSDVLSTVATKKAQLMSKGSEFSHTLQDGTTAWELLDEVNYHYVYAGENLAIHFYTNEELVSAWMNSESHKENILNPVYAEIGVGIAKGKWQDYEGYFVVQLFGTRSDSVEVCNDTYVLTSLVHSVCPQG